MIMEFTIYRSSYFNDVWAFNLRTKTWSEIEAKGECHDQGDAKWIVIRRPLRSHNNAPCEWPTPILPIGRLGVVRSQIVFGGFSYYQLIILISDIVPLIREFTIYRSSYFNDVWAFDLQTKTWSEIEAKGDAMIRGTLNG
jgi:hypothetical protein